MSEDGDEEDDTHDDLQVSDSSGSDDESGSDGTDDSDGGSDDGDDELEDGALATPSAAGSPGALADFTAPSPEKPGAGAGKPKLSLDQFAHGDALLSAIVARRDQKPDELDPTGGAGGASGGGASGGGGGKGWKAARNASKKGSLKRLGFLRVMRKKLEKQLAQTPEDGAVWERLGYVLHEQGEHEAARVKLERAQELGKGNRRLWRELGDNYLLLGRTDAAAAVYEKALVAPPEPGAAGGAGAGPSADDVDSWHQVARMYAARGDFARRTFAERPGSRLIESAACHTAQTWILTVA